MATLVGLQKTSLIDYPGKIAAVLFFPGCNLRCPWCHNGTLVDERSETFTESAELISTDDAVAFLTRRHSVLGGVVLSGGEPLLRPELGRIIERIKSIGLSVKLDTNGTLPVQLEDLLGQERTKPDYIAMDLKIAPERYREIEGKDASNALIRSVKELKDSGIDHEFRSVALPSEFFSDVDIHALAPLAGSTPWYFAPFRPGTCLNSRWNEFPPTTKADAERWANIARGIGANASVRGS